MYLINNAIFSICSQVIHDFCLQMIVFINVIMQNEHEIIDLNVFKKTFK